MNKFVVGIIVGVLSDEKVQQFLKDAASEILSGVISKELLPIFPFALGSAVKRFSELVPGVEVVKDAMATANEIREDLDEMITDFDTGFKPLDDLMDIWRPR
jgi:hypothetical protein